MNQEPLPAQGPVDGNVRGWMPIDTAPKDGTHLLLWRPSEKEGKENIAEGWWRLDVFGREYEWGGSGWSYPSFRGPTHWMPKPEAPNVQGEGPAARFSRTVPSTAGLAGVEGNKR